MNYTFLLALAAFLVITGPIVLIAAHREGKRRRAAREARSMRDHVSTRRPDDAPRPDLPRPDSPSANELATGSDMYKTLISRAYRESSWQERGMILRVYQLRKDLPVNQVADSGHPHLKLSEVLYQATERSRSAPKA
jgi:hypothetical protein